MARTQTHVQLTEELVSKLDERASRLKRSRSDLVCEAIERYLASDMEAEIDRRIVEGYSRVPQTADEDAWAQRAAREAVREEPW